MDDNPAPYQRPIPPWLLQAHNRNLRRATREQFLEKRPDETVKTWVIRTAPQARAILGGTATHDAVARLLAKYGKSRRRADDIEREVRRYLP